MFKYILCLLHFQIISSVVHIDLQMHQYVTWAFVIMVFFTNCINFTQFKYHREIFFASDIYGRIWCKINYLCLVRTGEFHFPNIS